MAGPVTKQDISRYHNMIDERGVCGARDVYKELNEKGHGYAGWAYGVSSGKTITGQAALNFMQQTEISKTGKRIPDNKVADIRVDMAYAYLDALKGNIPRGSNYTTKEVDFRTAAAFHKEVFNKHGYSIEHWTLHTPMRLIEKYHGSEKVENMWKTMMLTDGDYLDALLESLKLKNSMDKLARYDIYKKYENSPIILYISL